VVFSHSCAKLTRTLQLLLIAGILVNLVKGAELILRPHQEKWLQYKWESMTLWLHYSKPINWFFQSGKITQFFWISYALFFPVILVLALALLPELKWRYWIGVILCFLMTGGLFLYSVIMKNKEDDVYQLKIQQKLINWFSEGRTTRQYIFRLLLLATLTVVLIFLTYVSIIGLIRLKVASPWAFFVIIMFLVMPVVRLHGAYLVIINLGITSLTTLGLSLILLVAEFLLRILRGIAWRIAEYNKGAFAAIILVATALLGIIEFYLRVIKR
jgi:hypothetical protein